MEGSKHVEELEEQQRDLGRTHGQEQEQEQVHEQEQEREQGQGQGPADGDGAEQQQEIWCKLKDMFKSGSGSGDDEEVWMERMLIPGIPDELVLDCIFTKVSWQQLLTLSSVSRAWRATIQSREVYQARIRTVCTQVLVAVLHKVRAPKPPPVTLACPHSEEEEDEEDEEEDEEDDEEDEDEDEEDEEETTFMRAVEEISMESFHAPEYTYTLMGDDDDDELKDRSVPETFAYALSLHNPCDGSWQQLPPIPEVGCGIPLFSELVCIKGKLFVLGGRDQETWQPRREVYMLDLVAGSGVWQHCQNMITARASFACGVIDGKVYVAGGHSDVSCALSNAEVYDPELNVWEAVQDMHGPRSCCTVAIWDKNMYVIGGYTLSESEEDLAAQYEELDDSEDDDAEWANSAEVYDAAKKEWRQLGNMKNEYDEQACTVVNGQLYSFSTLGVEKFEASSNSWKQVYKDSWFMPSGDGSSPCLVLSVAAVDNEVFAMVCLGDECDRGCTLLKTVGFGLPGSRLVWQRVQCPVKFVGAFPALCAVEV
ncbi:hypothetical protein MPTK1_5g04070 [Marchantia polymorpha subsp. ruderalis]|uniref:F-box domain-containing protein n=2 Tax=Marchantia polymorpha TaxID=3197 RepID=A0AAF6BES0_MARPO|nr:hypothetical protein MARPO_0141s0015 [Marchantia polymorpha]BBN10504.1 hypothetical protein Mp_5g04070 [Marchantia polymorpha subsp. ruderalis]|eukprot:PTQ29434.1 hypothetical protein MARPO_0141s0015 [Marchantia polymorpha]